jgi:hypothetical protein
MRRAASPARRRRAGGPALFAGERSARSAEASEPSPGRELAGRGPARGHASVSEHGANVQGREYGAVRAASTWRSWDGRLMLSVRKPALCDEGGGAMRVGVR